MSKPKTLKVHVLIYEWKGLVCEQSSDVFFSFKAAEDAREKAMNKIGFFWDEKKEDWFDKHGYSADGANEYVYINVAEIKDLTIDVKLLDKQMKATFDSNMPKDIQDGIWNILAMLKDAVLDGVP
jgi:hypothetical protein